jgi:hypothetical protein
MSEFIHSLLYFMLALSFFQAGFWLGKLEFDEHAKEQHVIMMLFSAVLGVALIVAAKCYEGAV